MKLSVSHSKRKCTLIIVEEFHVEADVVRQRAEMLHQHVKFAHKQNTGFLGVVTGHFTLNLPIFAGNIDNNFQKCNINIIKVQTHGSK